MIYTTPAGDVSRLYDDITKQPHVLIAGATGSGKSVAINGILCCLLYNLPHEARLVLIDPKRVELVQYTRLPHTAVYASEPADIICAIQRTVEVMEARYREMQKQGLRRWNKGDVYVVIDEYADLITTQKKAVFTPLCRIAQLGRAAGVHLIIATQRPTRDIINGQIKVNIDARLALRCPTAQDSRNIINQNGAEVLPRFGEGLYLTPDTMHPVKVKVPLVPDAEQQRLIRWWLDQEPAPAPAKRSLWPFRRAG